MKGAGMASKSGYGGKHDVYTPRLLVQIANYHLASGSNAPVIAVMLVFPKVVVARSCMAGWQ